MKNVLLFLLLLAGVAAPARSQPIATAGPAWSPSLGAAGAAPALPVLPETWPVYIGSVMLFVLGIYFILGNHASRRFRR